jgi:hypothetical protein
VEEAIQTFTKKVLEPLAGSVEPRDGAEKT